MKAKTKTILIIAGVLAAIITAWYFIKKKKTATGAGEQGIKDAKTVWGGSSTSPEKKETQAEEKIWPLNKGSNNKYVSALQQHLNTKFKAGLVVDGKLGPLTYAALVRAKIFTPISLEQFNKIFGK